MADPPPGAARPVPGTASRPDRRTWLAGAAFGALVLVVLAAAAVPVPYISILPGDTTPVSGLISVSGAPSYPPDESVGFTTVSARRDITLLEAVHGWLDDDIEVVPETALLGDRSVEENRRYNIELMSDSIQVAKAVALDHLGYGVIRTSGVVVRDVAEDSPAKSALQLDDVIVAVDGEPIDLPGELSDRLQVGGVGASHLLTLERPAGSATRVELTVPTIASEDDEPRAVIGIIAEERFSPALDLPFEISIDSGDVGGPSAGLAFTLAVLDVLTPGDLTGDRRVAVTGTMALNGAVGPVGGGLQKAVTVRNAGYDAFLVPSDEFEVVRDAVGDDLDVLPVDTLDEALAALVELGGEPIARGPG
ncbi:MAG: S16 family serine protease [Acidimicrobiales bacterium]|nr:S16 family serine protease [Acidimicrobiales bacterium]